MIADIPSVCPRGHNDEQLHQKPKLDAPDTHSAAFGATCGVVNVPMMDDMFCEGLGAEMGWTCCEIITQSTAKKQACRDQYSVMMSEARVVNGIEEGPTEPPLDDWINCRI